MSNSPAAGHRSPAQHRQNERGDSKPRLASNVVTSGSLMAGVDVRADGGIVVLPPSLGYRWIADEDEPLPSLPPLWLAAIQGAGDLPPQPRRSTTRIDDDIVDDMLARMSPIVDGTRNGTLFRIGVRLRHHGRTEPEILDALDRINTLLAAPPLSGREVEKIARSAAREAR